MRVRRLAPWFRADASDRVEPFSYRAWKYLWQRLPINSGSDLFERIETESWDLLVILDACRYDVLRDLCDIGVVEPALSPASATPEFLKAAAEQHLFSNTTYVSANPQVAKVSPGEGCNVRNLFEDEWDSSLHTVPPDAVYDEAVRHVRDDERVVAHTLQPHYPHIFEMNGEVRPVVNGLHPEEIPSLGENSTVQAALASGLVDLGTARTSYLIASLYAWRQARDVAVELAREGFTTAITSDHGELFGEWGFVEHPYNVRVRELIEVPWLVLGPRQASTPTDGTADSVEQRLSALGYTEE